MGMLGVAISGFRLLRIQEFRVQSIDFLVLGLGVYASIRFRV